MIIVSIVLIPVPIAELIAPATRDASFERVKGQVPHSQSRVPAGSLDPGI